MEKKQYCPPRLELTSVKAETGFMGGSTVFDEGRDDGGVIIEKHEIGSSQDFFDNGNGTWDTNQFNNI